MAGQHAILQQACAFGVIPVVEIDDLADADALAETLLEAGLGVVEITFRTEAAADIIARIAGRHPDMLVGAGTVVSAETLDRAVQAGARFALAPGLSPRMLDAAAAAGLPYVPGAMTPSDLQAGIEHGLGTFKFFPAQPAGGLPFLRAIAAPFPLHDLRFTPPGGGAPANRAAGLRERAGAAVGGTWIANRASIRGGDWAGIGRNAAAAVQAARAARQAA